VIAFKLGSGSSKLSSNLVCRAYMVCEAFRDANGTTLWWTPLQNWRVLPDGIVFSEHNATSYNTITMDAQPNTGVDSRFAGSGTPAWKYFDNVEEAPPMTFTNLAAASGTTNAIVSFIEFKPSGSVNSSYISSVGFGGVRLVQGAVESYSTPSLVVSDSNNWTFVEYNQLHGRVRLRTRETYK
ncbi:hypothetical protein HQ590_03270, partial [bacterium]|nr:hypothetical protein [bacterium]